MVHMSCSQTWQKPIDYRDVEWIDPEYYKSLCWVLENDPSPLDLTFSAEADEVGSFATPTFHPLTNWP